MAVLIVDDDRDLVDVLTYIFRREGYEVIPAYDGENGWRRFVDELPEMVVLDANMEGLDGFEVCRRIRAESSVPVIMLTARTEEADIVRALDLGADDYVTKPFSPRQLVARVKALLRRAHAFSPDGGDSGDHFRCGDFSFQARTRTIERQGEAVRLTPLESKILHYLFVNQGHVLTSSSIVEHVWGYEGVGNEDLVKVHIRRLRQKVEENPSSPRHIVTSPGLGYTLQCPDRGSL